VEASPGDGEGGVRGGLSLDGGHGRKISVNGEL
jgi:hypothetical protein